MKFPSLFTLFLVLLLFSVTPLWGAPLNDCFECHKRQAFAGRVQHQPLVNGQCESCHQVHASKYPGLLTRSGRELCAPCHKDFSDNLERRSHLHAPVAKGECGACHDPHASDFKGLLKKKPGSECYDCHTKEKEKTFKYTHKPFAKGKCYACHDPHGANNSRLLKSDAPKVCLKCHAAGVALSRAHLGRKMDKVDCLSCHHPHGGDRQELLRSQRHEPFAQGNCRKCHQGSGPAQAGCLDCHKSVLATFLKPHNHLGAFTDNQFCLNCHDPHAADYKGLPAGYPGEPCRQCHTDKFQRRQDMLYAHVDNNLCGNCHMVHGTDRPAMLKDEAAKLCSACHKRHKQFSHPLGDKALDPRNHEPMNCITCHDPCNGTMHEYNLRGDAKRGLCVQCHRTY